LKNRQAASEVDIGATNEGTQRHCCPERMSRTQSSQLPVPARNKGRRPRWQPDDLAKVERLASQGLTFEQIADSLGIHVATLYRHKHQLSEFSEALKRGRAQFRDTLSRRFVDLVREGNVAAIIYATKVHLGWRENEPLVAINNHQNVHVAPDPAGLAADRNLIREAILILRRLGAPAALELDEADFKTPWEPNGGQG
jgi:hypothetical protein